MKLIEIDAAQEATLIKRVNRCLARLEINGREELAHVHDPGRLKEILFPGNRLLVRHCKRTTRKTEWDVIAADSPAGWVLIHSGYHRGIAEMLLDLGIPVKNRGYRAEALFGHSRIDFLLETDNRPMALEVKGCTLVRDGVALFPDAPTERGRRHIQTLVSLLDRGYSAGVMFLVMRGDARCFTANSETDPMFYRTIKEAILKGVQVYALKLVFHSNYIEYRGTVKICRDLIM